MSSLRFEKLFNSEIYTSKEEENKFTKMHEYRNKVSASKCNQKRCKSCKMFNKSCRVTDPMSAVCSQYEKRKK